MGTAALNLVGSSWSLGLNVGTDAVAATIKPRWPGTAQKQLAMGQTGMHTAKAHGNRGLPAVYRHKSSLLQSRPGQVWGRQAARVWREMSASGIAWPLGGGCVFLGPPSRAKRLPLEDWVVLGSLHGSVLPAGRSNLVLLSETWPV